MKETEELKIAIQGALTQLGIDGGDFSVTATDDVTHGDFASNVAFVVASVTGLTPIEEAKRILTQIQLPSYIDAATVAKPGYINFSFTREYFLKTITSLRSDSGAWGTSTSLQGRRILVEYTQPNPFKPFHIGHLMSNTIGESISRLIENAGATIKRANYQGDIGPHVAKTMWALMKRGASADDVSVLAAAYVEGTAAYEENLEAKQEIDDINKRLYSGELRESPLYIQGRETSLARFEELYAILGTTFDYYFFETESAPVGREVVTEGLAKKIFEESDGAIVFNGEQYGLHTRVFVTSKGTPTYETKELGLAVLKRKVFPYDENITITAVEQEQYFKVVTKAMDMVWPIHAGTYRHISHGMMQLAEGKMSSRKGNVITGESLIDDMREKAYEKMKERELGDKKAEIADAVAVAAIKYSILKQRMGKNIAFDQEASLSFEGNSGPYLQYAHTRACSVLRKASAIGLQASYDEVPGVASPLEKELARFPQVIARALHEYEPHHLTTYLTRLAALFNSMYAQEKIAVADDVCAPYRVAVTDAFRITMKRGLYLLGIKSPTEM